jgi:hypothetical protein
MGPRPAILRPDAITVKIKLNQDTWRWVRIRAAELNTTMSAIIEAALQQAESGDTLSAIIAWAEHHPEPSD